MELAVASERKTQLVDVTERLRALVRGEETAEMATLFVPHTTAGIVVQAAGAGAAKVAIDLEAAFERLVDEAGPWEHIHEGDRNPWAHVRAALAGSSVSIPLHEGRLGLGDHQAVFLAEFDGPRERTISVVLS